MIDKIYITAISREKKIAITSDDVILPIVEFYDYDGNIVEPEKADQGMAEGFDKFWRIDFKDFVEDWV